MDGRCWVRAYVCRKKLEYPPGAAQARLSLHLSKHHIVGNHVTACFNFATIVIAFWIHRLPCQDPECGFHCAKHRGCFTHNLTQEYVLNVTCYDAYDSWVTDFFTVTIDYNRAPHFLNLPRKFLMFLFSVINWR